MPTVNVQLDAAGAAVVAVFGCPQPDTIPNQAAIDSDDPRYLAFKTPAADLRAYANARATARLAEMRIYDAAGAIMKADATPATIAHLLALKQWGADNPTEIRNWIANDNTSTPATGAQFVALAPLVGAYAQAIYSTDLHTVLAGIADGTITTTAQIDAYPWTV